MIAAACLCCGTAVAAEVYLHFHNDVLVSAEETETVNLIENLLTFEEGPKALTDMIESSTWLAENWTSLDGEPAYCDDSLLESGSAVPQEDSKTETVETGETVSTYVTVSGGIHNWSHLEILQSDGPLMVRNLYTDDGAKKEEYTAELPSLLLDQTAQKIQMDLNWIEENYTAVPYGNFYQEIYDADGVEQEAYFQALYTAEDGRYFELFWDYAADSLETTSNFTSEALYEEAEYFTTDSGMEFILVEKNQALRAESKGTNFVIELLGGYLTIDEAEEILNQLALQVSAEPQS